MGGLTLKTPVVNPGDKGISGKNRRFQHILPL
jgi:hypothetical protein